MNINVAVNYNGVFADCAVEQMVPREDPSGVGSEEMNQTEMKN